MSPEEIITAVNSARARLRGQTRQEPLREAVPSPGRPGTAAPAVGVPGSEGVRYGLLELCGRDGVGFVEHAFRSLAGREPSAGEVAHCLAMLGRGETKPYVLAEVLRLAGLPLGLVPGLRLRYLAQRVFRVPGIGWLLRWAGSVARLPGALRYQRMIEQQLRADLATVREEARRLTDELARVDAQSASRIADLRAEWTALQSASEARIGELGAELARSTGQASAEAAAMRDVLRDGIASATSQWRESLHELRSELVAGLEDAGRRAASLEAVIGARIGPRPAGDSMMETVPDFLAEARATSEELGFGTLSGYSRDDARYHLFEAAFYNSRFVRVKQRIYLPFIDRAVAAAHPFLDIGCGRGEFLAILKEEGIPATGIDLNRVNVDHLAGQGFDVVHGDAIAHLRASGRTYGGITAFQVIEHLPRGGLEELVELAHARLAPGGCLILETVNPHAPYALANFFMDETHVAPLAPHRVAFLLQFAGFVDVRVVYSTPVPDFAIAGPEPRTHFNDFAVVGRRGAGPGGDAS